MPSSLLDRLETLRTLRIDQLSFKWLIGQGWTISELCDLLIDNVELPYRVRHELEWIILRPDWIFARRTERALMRLETAIALFTQSASELTATLQRAAVKKRGA